MASQPELYPISPNEFTEDSFRLDEILDEIDMINAVFAEAKKAHKDGISAKDLEKAEVRARIQRYRIQIKEGLMQKQLDAVFNEEEERRP